MTSCSRESERDVENVGKVGDVHGHNIVTDRNIYACPKSCSAVWLPKLYIRSDFVCMLSDTARN